MQEKYKIIADQINYCQEDERTIWTRQEKESLCNKEKYFIRMIQVEKFYLKKLDYNYC